MLTVQEVYGKLEEPDGLAGLSKLRSGGMKLSDQVLAAEKAGSWSEALGLHEQVRIMSTESDLHSADVAAKARRTVHSFVAVDKVWHTEQLSR